MDMNAVLTAATPSQADPSPQTWVLYAGEVIKIVMLLALTVIGQWEYFKLRRDDPET